MNEIHVGFAVCGSFCTHSQALDALEELTQIYDNIIPIASDFAVKTDTRFGKAEDFVAEMRKLCKGRSVISSIQAAEPIGPQKLLDVLVIAPCTGNTLAKLASGVADSAVTMAAKAHLRNGRPIVVAISTNDGLSTAARNIGELLCRKHYYFVPFSQDDPMGKPTSLVADMSLVARTVSEALEGRQIQPILLGAKQD
jgi:dipicolinate synthase subunit B